MVSPSSARALFQRALKINSQVKKLWLEYFKFELLYVELLLKRQAVLQVKDQEEDAVLKGKIVEILFENAQATIESLSKNFSSFVFRKFFVFRRSRIHLFIREDSLRIYSIVVRRIVDRSHLRRVKTRKGKYRSTLFRLVWRKNIRKIRWHNR